jgi:predicted nucleic acid-binding protein
MNVVDSSGWLEYFVDSKNAGHFAGPLEDRDKLIVPTICLYEVFKLVLRERGEEAALQAVALMKQGKQAPLTDSLAIQAAKMSMDYKLPMADSIILTTTRAFDAVVWTQDEDFSGIDGVKYFPKPS